MLIEIYIAFPETESYVKTIVEDVREQKKWFRWSCVIKQTQEKPRDIIKKIWRAKFKMVVRRTKTE